MKKISAVSFYIDYCRTQENVRVISSKFLTKFIGMMNLRNNDREYKIDKMKFTAWFGNEVALPMVLRVLGLTGWECITEEIKRE